MVLSPAIPTNSEDLVFINYTDPDLRNASRLMVFASG